MVYDLSGRVVVITGATGGFGEALAVALRKKGAKLALFGRKKPLLEKLVAELGAEHSRYWQADVVSTKELQAAFAETQKHFSRIDVVIANAGVEGAGPVETYDEEKFRQILDVNVLGVFRTFQAAIPYVKETQGYLAAVSSMAGFVHNPLQAPYAASKAAVWAFCDSLRLELRSYGVGVGSYHPSFFDTPLLAELDDNRAIQVLYSGHKGLWKKVPIEQVVSETVYGIEHRSELVTSPWTLGIVARLAGLVRPLLNYLGHGENVERALEAWYQDHPR